MKLFVDYTDDIVHAHSTIESPFRRESMKSLIKLSEMVRNSLPFVLPLIVIDILIFIFKR